MVVYRELYLLFLRCWTQVWGSGVIFQTLQKSLVKLRRALCPQGTGLLTNIGIRYWHQDRIHFSKREGIRTKVAFRVGWRSGGWPGARTTSFCVLQCWIREFVVSPDYVHLQIWEQAHLLIEFKWPYLGKKEKKKKTSRNGGDPDPHKTKYVKNYFWN